jgi:hypothetical protein
MRVPAAAGGDVRRGRALAVTVYAIVEAPATRWTSATTPDP